MFGFTTRTAAFALLLVLGACGGAGPPATTGGGSGDDDGVDGSVDGASAVSGLAEEPEPVASGGDDGHLCRRPIAKPAEVWERIEAVRALSEEERARECGLRFVETLARWRTVPLDLLRPIIERSAVDEPGFVAWIRRQFKDNSAAAVQAISMDVIRQWQVGADPAAVTERAYHWRKILGTEIPESISAALDTATGLPPLLMRVTEIHRLRCLLEVNPLGFAVTCEPIHPSGRPIVLTWKTTTRDGLLDGLEVTFCKGSSCKKIKRMAAKLLKQYRAVVEEVNALDGQVYREQIKTWLELPPFKSITT